MTPPGGSWNEAGQSEDPAVELLERLLLPDDHARQLLRQLLARARELVGGRIPLVLGRFSNLYGPGHNTEKGQGLIAMLCRACVRRAPLNLYVPMDTVRDYLYVDDAADLAWRATMSAVGEQPAGVHVEVIASGRAATVGEVIATIQAVAHRRVPLALGTDASARHQVPDLRLVPSVDVDTSTLTPLPAGIKRVFDAAISRAV